MSGNRSKLQNMMSNKRNKFHLLVVFAGGIPFLQNVFGFDSFFPANVELLSATPEALVQDLQLLQPFVAEL